MLAFFQLGGPVMGPLLAMALLSAVIVAERTVFWIRLARGNGDGDRRNARRNLGLLDAIVTASLLIGSFGTLTQIMRALPALAEDPSAVSGALIPTVAGFLIAIGTFLPRTYFVWKADDVGAIIEPLKASAAVPGEPVEKEAPVQQQPEPELVGGLSEKEKRFFLS